jgi:hypothetical protein
MDQSVESMKAELLAVGRQVQERLQGLTEADLAKPATWLGREVTVRFVMHRFSAHARDHALQLRKTRRGIEVPASEAQMILAQVAEARAALLGECIGLTDEQFERAPADGEWSAKQVLDHMIAIEKRNLAALDEALKAADK